MASNTDCQLVVGSAPAAETPEQIKTRVNSEIKTMIPQLKADFPTFAVDIERLWNTNNSGEVRKNPRTFDIWSFLQEWIAKADVSKLENHSAFSEYVNSITLPLSCHLCYQAYEAEITDGNADAQNVLWSYTKAIHEIEMYYWPACPCGKGRVRKGECTAGRKCTQLSPCPCGKGRVYKGECTAGRECTQLSLCPCDKGRVYKGECTARYRCSLLPICANCKVGLVYAEFCYNDKCTSRDNPSTL